MKDRCRFQAKDASLGCVVVRSSVLSFSSKLTSLENVKPHRSNHFHKLITILGQAFNLLVTIVDSFPTKAEVTRAEGCDIAISNSSCQAAGCSCESPGLIPLYN